MGTRGAVTWKMVKKVCRKKGIDISTRGSEARLIGPTPDGGKTTVIINHECCRGPSSIVWEPYVARMKRAFGITDEDLENA